MTLANKHLGDLLIESQLISDKQLRDFLATAENAHISLQQLVIEKGLISDHELGQIIAKAINVPYVELSKMIIPEELFNVIPERVVRNYKIMPFKRDKTHIWLGMSDPSNQRLISLIAKKTGRITKVHFATERDISATLQMFRKNLQAEIDELVKKEVGPSGNLSSDAPIIKIVQSIITQAYRDKASDIHIESEEENVLVRFRIDGILQDTLFINKSLHSGIITRIKVLSKLRTDEHFDAQDGKMRVKIDDETLDIRVSIVPTTEDEKVVLRLLSAKFRSFSLADLGMNKQDLDKIHKAISKTHGMILSTGPTGSGKTTSIYSLLKLLNTRDKNITTIEDPVEYRIKGVNHIPVNSRTTLTFVNGLRSILRQDPNIIFVGEIRDEETAGLVVNAALTGHLVFSTLHTNDAAGAIPRLIDMKVEPFLLASTINVILAQRLVRKICTVCKSQISINRDDFVGSLSDQMLKAFFGTKKSLKGFRGTGCKICHHTGFSGRVGIFEVLVVNETIRAMMVKKHDSVAIRNAAIAEGMTTLLDDGLQKISDGQTTMEEILRVIKIEEA